MAVTGAARVWVWVTAVITSLMSVGLVLLAWLGDLDTAGQAATVAGAVVALAALLVSVIALVRTGSGGPGGGGRRVSADQGSIAVGGNITGSAVGKNAKRTGPSTSPPPAATPPARNDDVSSRRGGIATGGDVTDSALGEGSER
ncbi:hypothetical protein [Streptomyces sp. NPDC101178]|uniref:hypothetical protein n=1 Tax=Streptomyces sp. NPDC101178 TaxID=3366124 RepID=UPI00381CCAA7